MEMEKTITNPMLCKKCEHKDVCEHKVRLGRKHKCDHFDDEALILHLPVPIGTTVFRVVKNCDKCNKYKEVPYSDCVSCDDDLSLFNPTLESEQCRKCIEFNPVKFDASMIDNIGTSIFLNPDDFWKMIDDQKENKYD